MLNSWESRDWFISNAITYLRKRNFDGLDINFYGLGIAEGEKKKFSLFCKV